MKGSVDSAMAALVIESWGRVSPISARTSACMTSSLRTIAEVAFALLGVKVVALHLIVVLNLRFLLLIFILW